MHSSSLDVKLEGLFFVWRKRYVEWQLQLFLRIETVAELENDDWSMLSALPIPNPWI